MNLAPHFGGLLRSMSVFVFIMPGCGDWKDNLPREPISGTVTFDGKPLKSGTIQFIPVSQTEGVASGGFVTDGRFKVPEKDGPIPGKYTVMIFARDENPQPAPVEDEMPGVVQGKRSTSAGLIPLRYNLQTELTAEVKHDVPNTYDFPLKKK